MNVHGYNHTRHELARVERIERHIERARKRGNNMKTKKDKANEHLSIFCGALVAVFIIFFVLLGGIINLALAESKQAIDYSKRVL